MQLRRARRLLALLPLAAVAPAAHGVVMTGDGGQGVPVGQSSLIGRLDYSDTFTGTDSGGRPNRPYQAAIQPAAAYGVETAYGNPAASFTQNRASIPLNTPNFSFAGGSTPGSMGLVQGNAESVFPGDSGAGSATGFSQTGGGVDYGIPYGLRDHYVVQVDATTVQDRIDITTAPAPGNIFQPNSLSVFFRGQATGANAGNISLFRVINGVNTDTPVRGQPGFEAFDTGLAGSRDWHNYAVRFDRLGNEIEIYVDEQSLGVIDLTAFAGGIYADFSNGAVGAGGSPGGGDRVWTDNFQVGAVPEPGTFAMASLALLTLAARRRR